MTFKDQEILQRLQSGDQTAYKALFDLYYKPLCIYSLKFSDSLELSEDVVQDLFVAIWESDLYLKLVGTMAPYLFTAVKNNTLQVMRKEHMLVLEEIEDKVVEYMQEDSMSGKEWEKNQRKLMDSVEALPEKSKEVFKAIVFENMKYKEVAEQLNISVNTVKTHYSRALKQLRNCLDIMVLFLLLKKI